VKELMRRLPIVNRDGIRQGRLLLEHELGDGGVILKTQHRGEALSTPTQDKGNGRPVNEEERVRRHLQKRGESESRGDL